MTAATTTTSVIITSSIIITVCAVRITQRTNGSAGRHSNYLKTFLENYFVSSAGNTRLQAFNS